MKIAIVYFSQRGNVSYSAQKIADTLGDNADLIEIKPLKPYPSKGLGQFLFGGRSAINKSTPELEPYDFAPDSYDAVVIGTPIWASRIAPPIRSFIKQNLSTLRSKTIAAFFCYRGAGYEKALKSLKEALFIVKKIPSIALKEPLYKPNIKNDEIIAGFCDELLAGV